MSELLEQLCEEMHDRYEKAATGAGWETNPESRKPWSGVPEANKATMRAAIGPIADHIAELEAIGDGTCENCAKLEDDVDRLRESEKFFSEKCGDAELKVLELEATIEKVEALIPDWREYALDGTLGSSAVDCADDLEVALGDKV